ncbi:CPBP family glutamic-type intramembrane protease [Aliifodinibius sp. S!AR15-10]|uniref:CPBP family intramembrane glutamic endopeptidase n=1 Tax=Aliifodinibius sp. S!AR15-10 TaxID=2950437 RepID=UPI00285EA47E|nr:CPBP family intramembrane glutamic endopeptidase [Aliifodinibius sp. S!AR15-10]MDR8391511.1 CPBP family glutamic-type intramembrane protease [Aliifodinibius sp. S!AR15-10]
MDNRYYLFAEFLVLFIGLPLAFYFDLVSIPKIAGLLAVSLFTVLVLWFDKRHDFSKLFSLPDGNASVQKLLLKSLAVALTITGLVLLLNPDELFIFPRQQPLVWMIVMLLYPLLSALPQELIYRAFFFERYDKLFPSEQLLGIASAIAFSALHIIYDNWWAVGLSLVGGFIFVQTYRKSRSLYWVSVEHAIYGCLVFTIGMGHFFYEAF